MCARMLHDDSLSNAPGSCQRTPREVDPAVRYTSQHCAI